MPIPNGVSVTKKITLNTSISTPGITMSPLLELTSNRYIASIIDSEMKANIINSFELPSLR